MHEKHNRYLFRFENLWLDFTSCHEIVREALWSPSHGNPLHIFLHLLSRTRFKLTQWKSNGINSLEKALTLTEANIYNLENTDDSIDTQINLSVQYDKLAALQRQISIKWQQRAKLLWVCDGDKNTSFFHNSARICPHYKNISQITDSSRNIHFDYSSIEHAFMNFYTNLWFGSRINEFIDFKDILNALPNDLPSISPETGHQHICEVTKEEVYLALLDLPSYKSPGPDCFNIEFYHFFLNDIGDRLVSAVSHFFNTSLLPSS